MFATAPHPRTGAVPNCPRHAAALALAGWYLRKLNDYCETVTREERSMIDAAESQILELLEWVATGERSYDQVMDAWRTSCPRFPVWEDANERGLVTKKQVNGQLYIRITSLGLALLEQRRRA